MYNKNKQKIKHRLLNIFTILSLLLSSNNGKVNNTELNEIIKIGSMLVGHEDIILKGNCNMFIQDLSLKQLIYSGFLINDFEINKKKLKFLYNDKDMTIKGDRYYMGEVINQIIYVLTKKSNYISISVDSIERILIFEHNGDLPITCFEKKDIMKCLDKKKAESIEILNQLCIKFLSIMKISLLCSKNQIALHF